MCSSAGGSRIYLSALPPHNDRVAPAFAFVVPYQIVSDMSSWNFTTLDCGVFPNPGTIVQLICSNCSCAIKKIASWPSRLTR